MSIDRQRTAHLSPESGQRASTRSGPRWPRAHAPAGAALAVGGLAAVALGGVAAGCRAVRPSSGSGPAGPAAGPRPPRLGVHRSGDRGDHGGVLPCPLSPHRDPRRDAQRPGAAGCGWPTRWSCRCCLPRARRSGSRSPSPSPETAHRWSTGRIRPAGSPSPPGTPPTPPSLSGCWCWRIGGFDRATATSPPSAPPCSPPARSGGRRSTSGCTGPATWPADGRSALYGSACSPCSARPLPTRLRCSHSLSRPIPPATAVGPAVVDGPGNPRRDDHRALEP